MHRLARIRHHIACCGRAGGLLVLALSLTAAGCSDKPTEKDCKALLDRVIDLEIGAAGTEKLSPEMKADLDKQRKQLEQYLGTSFMDRCLQDTPVAVIKCGLDAKTREDYAACDEQ
jgi:hypothetical protein